MTPIEQLLDLFARTPLTLSSEAALQAQIEDELKKRGLSYAREVKLDPKNRIDFMCGRVGIEVKIQSPAKAIFKQLERYCQFDQVDAIILVTGRTIGLPPTIVGKQCYIAKLGRAWL